MRKMLGILVAASVALSATSAFAGCHGGSVRAYDEYMRFKGAVGADVLAGSKDIVAEIDDYFVTKYPKGQLKVDPSRLTDAEIAVQQVAVTEDYRWLKGKLTDLRERSRKAGADDTALQWLAYVDLPLYYGTPTSQRILREELPKLASFSDSDVYPKAKYDAVVQACATSLEKHGYAGAFMIESEAFFVTCGKIQPSDKRVDGHMQLTHSILDNVSALEAYEKDNGSWLKSLLTTL